MKLLHKVLQINVTRFNLIPHDVHVIVPVSSGLLVPEAQSVQELMLDGSQTITVFANGQPLLPHMLVSYRRGTSAETESKMQSLSKLHHLPCISASVCQNIPAPFEHRDVVLLSFPWCEVDAGLQSELVKYLQDQPLCIHFYKRKKRE